MRSAFFILIVFWICSFNLWAQDSLQPIPHVRAVSTQNGEIYSLEELQNHESVYLPANENIVTIEFSARGDALNEKPQFRYQLEGLDKTWIDAKTSRAITYAYLPGGDYIFKLQATHHPNQWNGEVYELPIHIGKPWYNSMLFWIIVAGVILSLGYAFYLDRLNLWKKESRLKAEFEKQMAVLEMRALRAQMNPHFIFNCLNSIDSYIIRNDTRKASEYLNQFSRLVRLILQNSRGSYVSLKDELEALELYIKLEQMRFRESFDYEIRLEENMNPENFEIPPMLIQPYVENAIWHGLSYRENGGKVVIDIYQKGDNLVCTIEDNGIGRVAAAKIRAAKKVKRRSMGMDITAERIEVVNKIYRTQNKVEIQDLYDENRKASGTRVILQIPF